MFVGHISTGGSVSLTVTLKEQLAVPATFEAVHVTAFVPMGNEYGEEITVEAILNVTVGVGLPVAVGARARVRAHVPGKVFVVMFDGQVMVGGVLVVVELTVTVKAQVVVLPAPFVAVRVTGVAPNGNAEPDGGTQLVVT